MARLYDIAAAPENRELMTFTSPKTGAPVLRAYQIPQTPCRSARAAAVLGEMGGGDLRPDGPHARPRRRLLLRLCGGAERVRRRRTEVRRQRRRVLRAHARRASLCSATRSCRRRSTAASPRTSRAIRRSTPAWSRSATTASSSPARSSSRPAACCPTGIHLSCIHPLQPGDENYANCLAVPVNAPGVKLYPRRPFALRADNSFDYPLSSRFDESDSYVVFDNVFVPWEHVFIYRNLEVSPRPVVEDAVAPLRQPSGAGALRHQAALHDRARAAHERDDRQRRGSRRCRS